MPRLFPDVLTTAAGAATLVVGAGLTAAPARTARILGLGGSAQSARALGIADLALAPALLVGGRNRGPAMIVRAALNVLVAGRFRAESARPDGSPRAAGGATAMAVLTVVDGLAGVVLLREALRP